MAPSKITSTLVLSYSSDWRGRCFHIKWNNSAKKSKKVQRKMCNFVPEILGKSNFMFSRFLHRNYFSKVPCRTRPFLPCDLFVFARFATRFFTNDLINERINGVIIKKPLHRLMKTYHPLLTTSESGTNFR